ncbi:D-2-hydroxyacid dehydrogenase [Lewinella sp. JB7]|uniref:D-2-hydroxyacid dehydrogenase n=1 Tax=Lewinella sp. JB7 TaxID=2962887 RepID=UPI0020CA1034|nr:D-2-hydroxyacid dehydrogenase [Lewinella sp. JB7]MCP9235994.1 D-2-hydroxyacid dehydrogenase [Lewinella sp. JB7]
MIYVKLPLNLTEVAYLRTRSAGEELCLEQDIPDSERRAAFLAAEIVLGNVPPDWLTASDQLRWAQLSSAGFRPYSTLSDRDLNFAITNCAGVFGIPVAETALAGILALVRGIPTFVRDKGERHWRGDLIRPELGKLSGSQVILLGHGDIGGSVRRMLQGFGCMVSTMGHRRGSGADFYTVEELDNRLPAADVVVAALPETEQTVGLFGPDRLALLAPHCILVNVGRGSLIDEAALLEQLRAGKLGGAVLDVTGHEPLPEDDPLWTAPRTLLTQHSAGGARDEHRLIIDRFLHNFRRFRSGEPLEYVVDLGRGY